MPDLPANQLHSRLVLNLALAILVTGCKANQPPQEPPANLPLSEHAYGIPAPINRWEPGVNFAPDALPPGPFAVIRDTARWNSFWRGSDAERDPLALDFREITLLAVRLPIDSTLPAPDPELRVDDKRITVLLEPRTYPTHVSDTRGFAIYSVPRAQGQIVRVTFKEPKPHPTE
jgi:hypothetical protein